MLWFCWRWQFIGRSKYMTLFSNQTSKIWALTEDLRCFNKDVAAVVFFDRSLPQGSSGSRVSSIGLFAFEISSRQWQASQLRSTPCFSKNEMEEICFSCRIKGDWRIWWLDNLTKLEDGRWISTLQ